MAMFHNRATRSFPFYINIFIYFSYLYDLEYTQSKINEIEFNEKSLSRFSIIMIINIETLI